MAVLVEAISLIARRDRLDECWPMASEGFIADAPNGSVCAHDYLVRIGPTSCLRCMSFSTTMRDATWDGRADKVTALTV